MASRKTLLSFGLVIIIVGFTLIVLSLQSYRNVASYAEYFRAFGLGSLALGVPLTIGSLSTNSEKTAKKEIVLTRTFQPAHVAFIQVFIGVFLAAFLTFFTRFEGLVMKVALLGGSIAGALVFAIIVFGILKVRPIRNAVLGFLDWITE